MHKDEGIDFDAILQAQQTSTHLQAYQHDLLDSDSSDDEESVTGLEVNAHNLKGRVDNKQPEGLLDFSDSDNEDIGGIPSSMEEANAELERTKAEEEDKGRLVSYGAATRAPEGLLAFLDSEGEEVEQEMSTAAPATGQGHTANTEKVSPDSHLTEMTRQ